MASVVELLAHLNNVFANQRGFFIEIDEDLCNYLSIIFQSLNVNDDINKYKMNLEYDIQDGTIRMLFYSDPLKKLIGRERNEFIFLEDFRKLVLSIVNRI